MNIELNKTKNQNSILVLTAIGVYFGLLLAGATPQVLASAALAREFNVRDEIETRDDFDNKPDDERSPIGVSVQIYLEDVEYFLASLGQLREKGKFDLQKDRFNVAQTTLLPCVDRNLAGRYTPVRFDTTSEASRSALDFFSRGMSYGYSLGDCIPNTEFRDINAVDSRFDFLLNEKGFVVNVVVKKDNSQRAAELAGQLTHTIQAFVKPDNNRFRRQIIENTTFRSENDQVFVVTRLPRAALEPLLVKDAK